MISAKSRCNLNLLSKNLLFYSLLFDPVYFINDGLFFFLSKFKDIGWHEQLRCPFFQLTFDRLNFEFSLIQHYIDTFGFFYGIEKQILSIKNVFLCVILFSFFLKFLEMLLDFAYFFGFVFPHFISLLFFVMHGFYALPIIQLLKTSRDRDMLFIRIRFRLLRLGRRRL